MQDRQNWLTIAAIVLVVGGLGAFLYRQSQQQVEEVDVVDQEDQARERAEQLLQQLDVEVPDDATRVNLRDVSGEGGAGIATRREDSDRLLQSILVALPEPGAGEFYEAYLVADNDEVESLYLGKLRSVKGGWTLDYRLTSQQADQYRQIQITRETNDDRESEEVVLEAEFPAQEAMEDSQSEE